MERHLELLAKAKAAIMGVNRALGHPGDYGYYSKEGKALNELYNVHNEIADELAVADPLKRWTPGATETVAE